MSYRISILTLAVIATFSIRAQHDLMLYNLPGVGQSIYVNPAHAPHDGIHIGLPFMSSTSIHHTNSILNPSQLFANAEGRVEFQTEDFLDRIAERNELGLDMASDIFSIGIPIKGNYFSFSLRDKVSAGITFPGDMLKFPFTGNGNFLETEGVLDFSELSVQVNHYAEFAVGWQKVFADKFYLGSRVKYFAGKENITTSNNTLQWITDQTDYSWTVEGDVQIQSSGVGNLLDSIDGNSLLENGQIGKYLLGGGNSGMGLDLGFGMQMNERLDWGISIIDLGYIRWTQNNQNYTGIGEDVAFSGIEITEAFIQEGGSFSDSLSAALEGLGESLQESFNVDENTDAYTSFLNTRLYGSVGYRLFKKAKSSGKANLVLHTELQNGIRFPSMALSYVHTLADRISLSASYAAIDKDFKNIGVGLSIKGGPIVFYATMDNVLWLNMSKVKLDSASESISYPSYSQVATMHFGMNIALASKSKTDSSQPRLD
ncbi:MAG: hypothetical protein HKN45_01655 [Flavobacteriales bacterium]|nr:hypothetical protein [Flavobacteriales bacterium]NNK80829.1 hypothetical protein [Flavobacteriales bacterium]